MVGQHMADYLVKDGPLAKTIDALLAKGFGISWYDRIADLIAEPIGGPVIDGAATGNVLPRPTRSGRRVKYHCSKCKLNAWAKPGARLICADCQLPMTPQSSPARNSARPHAPQAVPALERPP